MTQDTQPPFYLSDRTIYKRSVTREENDRLIMTLGFPVCTLSEYADPKVILKLFNEHDA